MTVNESTLTLHPDTAGLLVTTSCQYGYVLPSGAREENTSCLVCEVSSYTLQDWHLCER